MKKSKFRGPESAHTKKLIALLEKTARKNKEKGKEGGAWSALAEFLKKPARKKKNGVNLFKIDKLSREGDFIVVPSIVLGEGSLSKNIRVFAFKASKSAREKLGGKLLPLEKAVEENPQAKNVRIII